MRTVLGMFQYLAKFVYDMSSVMKPMTDLLKSDVVWSIKLRLIRRKNC